MGIRKFKPTTPGRRGSSVADFVEVTRSTPEKSLVRPISKTGGRNNAGRITTRHIGGGHKQHYRIIDFKRDKEGIAARVERIEYDPNRTAHIALLCYADGERRYIIAPKGLKAGDQVIAGRDAPIKAGNTLPIRNIPVGSIVHCVEMMPGKGAQIARSAGTSVTLMAREGIYAQLRLRSGEVRKIHIDCRATIGEVSNEEHSLQQYGKAGATRWRCWSRGWTTSSTAWGSAPRAPRPGSWCRTRRSPSMAKSSTSRRTRSRPATWSRCARSPRANCASPTR